MTVQEGRYTGIQHRDLDVLRWILCEVDVSNVDSIDDVLDCTRLRLEVPAGHAFFHGEKGPGPLAAGTVIAIGNCGLYAGPWGVRDEDTVAVGQDGPIRLTNFPRCL